ncbi:MAG TPA: hypothetical protein VHZ03_47865, partial [Trebonia sp.]|nr:hypothetical protein [Trebonia sp.]
SARFFCRNAACARATFAEQVPGLAGRYARRTTGLSETLSAVALALGVGDHVIPQGSDQVIPLVLAVFLF